MSKKLQKAADDLEAAWAKHPAPKPYKARIQADEERIQTRTLLRTLVDLLRDNIR
jgi:hypothetical protein